MEGLATRLTRGIVVAIALLIGLFDAVGTISIVGEGRRCGPDCTAGVVLFPVAPTITPLLVVGVGDQDAEPATAAVVAAYALVLVLVATWWWFVVGALRDRLWLLPLGVVATLLLKLPTLAVQDVAGAWAGIPVELGLLQLARVARARWTST